MKKLFFVMLAVAALAGCVKTSDKPIDLVGTWQWEMAIGGIGGQDTIRAADINVLELLVLDAQGKYKRTTNGQVTDEGSYKIAEVNSVLFPEKAPALVFDDTDAHFIGWYQGFLVLVENRADGYSNLYRRK